MSASHSTTITMSATHSTTIKDRNKVGVSLPNWIPMFDFDLLVVVVDIRNLFIIKI